MENASFYELVVLGDVVAVHQMLLVSQAEGLVCDHYYNFYYRSCRQDSLSGCVGTCLLGGEDVPGGGFVAVCLDGHGGGSRRG